MLVENQPVPAVGASAPDFTLPSTSGEKVTLSDYRAKHAVLVAFFPLAFTSTCTEELCDFTNDYDSFSKSGVVVLPISVDSVPTLREFKAKYNMKTDLLSDFKREAIDKSGVISWEHIESTPSGKRSNAEILEEIAKL